MSIIALDMMGGDFAPEQAVKGVAAYLKNNSNDTHLLLLGAQDLLALQKTFLLINTASFLLRK